MAKKVRIFPLILFVAYLALLARALFGRISPETASLLPNSIFGIATDKVIHFLLFFPAPLLSFMAFRGKRRGVSILVIFIVCVVVAAGMELGQGLTGYRTVDINDFVANITSVISATMLLSLINLLKVERLRDRK